MPDLDVQEVQLPKAMYPGTAGARVVKGVGANLVGQALNIGSRFILTPLFLWAWGADLYGTWLLLASFVSHLALTNMGAQLYVVNRLTNAYARGDLRLFRTILHSGLALLLVLPGVVLLLFSGVICVLPWGSVLHLSAAARQAMVWVLLALGLRVLIALPQGLVVGVYRAVGLFPFGAMLGNVLQVMEIILVGGALIGGGGMLAVACLQIAAPVAVAVFAQFDLNRRFPHLRVFSLSEASLPMVRSFISPSAHFFVIEMAQALNTQGVLLVVGIVLGPVEVVIFSTMRTMINVMRQLVAAIAHAAWPEMNRLDAQQDWEKLLSLFRALLRSALVGGATVAVVLHLWGGELYHIWLRGRLSYDPQLMGLFLLYGLQLTFWSAGSFLLMAVNRHERLANVLLAASLLALGLVFLGGRAYGTAGCVAALVAADALLPLWCVPVLLRKYKRHFNGAFYVRECLPVACGMAVAAGVPWAAPVALVALAVWWARSLTLARWRSVWSLGY